MLTQQRDELKSKEEAFKIKVLTTAKDALILEEEKKNVERLNINLKEREKEYSEKARVLKEKQEKFIIQEELFARKQMVEELAYTKKRTQPRTTSSSDGKCPYFTSLLK